MARFNRKVMPHWRSGFEEEVAAFLKLHQNKVRYEKLKIEWIDLAYRKYTPDFLLDNGIIIETKGRFVASDRRKHLEIKRQHPELDIRFVFTNSNAKLYKGSKSNYEQWCNKHNFKSAHRVIPMEWLKERGKPIKDKIVYVKKRVKV